MIYQKSKKLTHTIVKKERSKDAPKIETMNLKTQRILKNIAVTDMYKQLNDLNNRMKIKQQKTDFILLNQQVDLDLTNQKKSDLLQR